MKQISSAIIMPRMESPSRTGTQLSVTGSAKPPSFPRPQSPVSKPDPLDELPPLVRAIVPSGTALLISWLRFSKEPLPEKYRARALAALKKLEADLVHYRPPSDPADVINALELAAKTLQVPLPDEEGLMVYAAILSELPTVLLKESVIQVCKTYKYPTMPKPADFLEAVAEQAWQYRWLHMSLQKWIGLVESA